MTAIKPAASLTSDLLVRKGFARPAMRSPLRHPRDDGAAALRPLDDLGWNDLGEDFAVLAYSPKPEFVLQNDALAKLICVAPGSRRARGTALGEGRRAAFTLRVDAQRHSALRLACSLTGQSAQHLLTAALDRLLAELPEIAALAVQPRGTTP